MKLNRFIEPIILKRKKHDFKAWLKKRALIKEINRTSPSFDMMCEIVIFLELLREMYMYANNDTFHLFTATIPKGRAKQLTYSMIYKEENFNIKFLLFRESKTINIEISRGGRSDIDKEVISFVDGGYQFKDYYDEEKMRFIVSCLMNGLVELINYYYKNKKF